MQIRGKPIDPKGTSLKGEIDLLGLDDNPVHPILRMHASRPLLFAIVVTKQRVVQKVETRALLSFSRKYSGVSLETQKNACMGSLTILE